MRNDDSFATGDSFPLRVQQTYDKKETPCLLQAYALALERVDEEIDDHLRAAYALLDQRADAVVVTAALLTGPYRHGDLPVSEIQSVFGSNIGNLVARASADGLLTTPTEPRRIGDLRRWLEEVSVDIRTVVLRVGLQLGTVEALAGKERSGEEDQNDDAADVARETFDLYVPLADRMGMGALRTRLEDASFRLLQPAVHAEMTKSLQPIREEDQACLALIENGVAQLLNQRGIDATIQGRTKGLYSLYRKMRRLDSSLDEVMDRIGLRIIVDSVETCYQVLGLLHTRFRPVPGTFDDYIGFPKENGYQSLHTCVYPVPDISAKPVEFQIRTEAMHHEAEYGVAAHWLYKDQEETRTEGQEQLDRLRDLLSEENRDLNSEAFLERLHRRVSDDRLVLPRWTTSLLAL